MRKTLICMLVVVALSCDKPEAPEPAPPPRSAPVAEGGDGGTAPDPETITAGTTDTSPPVLTSLPRPPPRATPAPPRPRPAQAELPVTEIELRNYVKVPVFYGTTRKLDGSDRKNVYGGERGNLQYGVSWVSIPRSHEPGELEEPSLLTLTFREDPARHVVLLEVNALPKERWFSRLNASIAGAGSNQAFVFIHGFSTNFSDAARRTAQIKYDLGFAGPAILFSWPSLGRETMYLADRESADFSVPLFANFLVDLQRRTGTTTIHIIAHSMGNRLLTRAIERIDLDASILPKPRFSQVMLAAPDIDAEVFRDELAPRMVKLARGVTLYGASDDRALRLSRELNAVARAGEGGENLPVIAGIDSIDVTGIDASFLKHSYIGGVSVLGDIAQTICEGKSIGDRLGITKVPKGWRLVTSAEKRKPRPCNGRP